MSAPSFSAYEPMLPSCAARTAQVLRALEMHGVQPRAACCWLSRSRARALAELEKMRAWTRAALALFSIVYAFAIGGGCIGGGCSTCHERARANACACLGAARASSLAELITCAPR